MTLNRRKYSPVGMEKITEHAVISHSILQINRYLSVLKKSYVLEVDINVSNALFRTMLVNL